MSNWLFDKIAEELADYKDWVRLTDVQRAGEPLLDKKLIPRIKKLKANGMRGISIATNSMLLDEERARGLIEAGLDEIMFAIDSIEEEQYKKIKVGLDFKTVIGSIERFSLYAMRYSPNWSPGSGACRFTISTAKRSSANSTPGSAFGINSKRP